MPDRFTTGFAVGAATLAAVVLGLCAVALYELYIDHEQHKEWYR